jgi:hypothetical protein
MVMYDLPSYFFKFIFQNIINMPCGKKNLCATCHNLGPSLTIIMDDGNQYFKKINFMSKNFHNVMCQILTYG